MRSVSSRPASVHLVLGEEELLMQRAVGAIVGQTRAASAQPETLPVDRLRAGEAGSTKLAELLSPSLFGEDRVVVLEAAAEAGAGPAGVIAAAAADPPEGVVLVVLHSGGGRAKALVGELRRAGATVHDCAAPPAHQRVDFVRNEFRDAGVKVSAAVANAVLAAVGSDLRELAAACSQLAADTGGKVDSAAVRRYYQGRAEVTGFDVAERAVTGDSAAALVALRWAQLRGVPTVVLADSLADTVHTIARVGSAGRGDPFTLASRLGLPPWKVRKAQGQARGWSPATIGTAVQIVADLNADVKGGAADPNYALERALLQVSDLRAAA